LTQIKLGLIKLKKFGHRRLLLIKISGTLNARINPLNSHRYWTLACERKNLKYVNRTQIIILLYKNVNNDYNVIMVPDDEKKNCWKLIKILSHRTSSELSFTGIKLANFIVRRTDILVSMKYSFTCDNCVPSMMKIIYWFCDRNIKYYKSLYVLTFLTNYYILWERKDILMVTAAFY